MDINAYIGKRIQEIRKQKGFSGEEVATFLGLSRSSISNMEQGRHGITNEHLFYLSCIDKSRLLFALKNNEIGYIYSIIGIYDFLSFSKRPISSRHFKLAFIVKPKK